MGVSYGDRADTPGCSTWALVVKGKKIRSLPCFDSQDDIEDLELFNFFSPLTALPASPSPLLNVDSFNEAKSGVSKRHRSPTSNSSSRTASPSVKRPRWIVSSPEENRETPAPTAKSGPPAAPAAFQPLSGPGSTGCANGEDAPTATSRSPAVPALLQPSSHLGSSSYETAPLIPLDTIRANAKPGSPASPLYRLSPKLSTYSDGMVSSCPETVVAGDSIVRYMTLPGAITYCLPGGKVGDLIELISALIDLHPTVKSVITHVGTNDVMARKSSQLHADLESLCHTVESIGRHCIMSGPIPAPSKGSELFS